MKKTMTRKIAVVAVLIIAFVILAMVMPGQHILKCGDCDGTGMVDAAVCDSGYCEVVFLYACAVYFGRRCIYRQKESI